MQSSAYEDMYYEQGSNSTHVMPELAFHGDDMANELGATLLIGSCPKLVSASSTSCDNNNRGGLLIPRGGTSVGKPIRRRSRSSKKLSPTTLLNANPNNFRSLVQQFTGCHTAPLAGNTAAYRGPITLNFSQHKHRRSQNLDHYQSSDQIQQQWSTTMASSDEQVDQSFFSFTTNSIASTTNNINVTTTDHAHDRQLFRVPAVNYYEPPPRPDPLTLDDFDLESLSLQQVSAPEDDYSAGTRNDDDPFFWGF